MKLCDNPTCSSHCDVIYSNHWKLWCFANGFQSPLTKEQLNDFNPNSKLNICRKCRGIYNFMLKRMRDLNKHRKTAQPHEQSK